MAGNIIVLGFSEIEKSVLEKVIVIDIKNSVPYSLISFLRLRLYSMRNICNAHKQIQQMELTVDKMEFLYSICEALK